MQCNNEIAVRLYDNPLYGTTHGKGLYRKAIFNGTADITAPSAKYLLDFESVEHWAHRSANANDDIMCEHVNNSVNGNLLASWIVRYDTATKAKVRVNGFCTIDLQANKLELLIEDAEFGIEQTWRLDVKPCKTVIGKKSPQLLATNAELNRV
jgi:hypothetical protein